jgi:hypothetical protein
MPVQVRISEGGLPNVFSRPGSNLSQVAGTPNPNSGIETFKRGQAPPSLYAAGNAANMQFAPVNRAGLQVAADATDQADRDQNAAATQRLVQELRISQADAIQKQRDNLMNQTAVRIMNPDARLYTQSLRNAGVNELQTSAAGRLDDPFSKLRQQPGSIRTSSQGFFDVQDPRAQQRQALLRELMIKDANEGRR